MRCHILFTAVASVLAMSGAHAELVNVTATGTVAFNVIQGNQTGTGSGAPVVMSFNVDSDVFVNSVNFPTRGYDIIPASFSLLVGGQPIHLVHPQPGGPARFVLRNNDPAVDGFFLSRNNVDFPVAVNVTIPGLTPIHDLNFSRSFNDGTPFPSLNILECLGTYGTANLAAFQWTVGRLGGVGAEYNYQSLTISIVPEPSCAAVLAGLAGLMGRRRGA
ncbi:MAG: hypothetical protein NZ561_05900 [Phycisphaerae bacterium]|nr:hypothetical protein [Phycisphaerae bacterium]MDW8263460.1 hypothetical protein [Phycisphaerales bacterium]